MILVEEASDYTLMVDIENCHLYYSIKIKDREIEIKNHGFPNLKTLSASLRSEVGFDIAFNFLMNNDVDKNSDLWDLNHSNPWKE